MGNLDELIAAAGSSIQCANNSRFADTPAKQTTFLLESIACSLMAIAISATYPPVIINEAEPDSEG